MRSLLRVIAPFASTILWAASVVAQTHQVTWGSFGTAPTQFRSPKGIGVDFDVPGTVYVADTDNNRIQKFDHDGGLITLWGTPGSGVGQLLHPQGVAVRRNGVGSWIVYVADTANNRIHTFSHTGSTANSIIWGSPGSGNGQFLSPAGVATNATNGWVYVADTNNNRIQYFDSLGTYQGKWGTLGSANGQFNLPQGVAVDGSGLVYVADTRNNRVQKFTATGGYLLSWGISGSNMGHFNLPEGIAVADLNVYVADTGNNRIQLFSLSGVWRAAWGSGGTGDGQFQSPTAVGVNLSSGEIFVADTGNNRMQRFGLVLDVPTLGEWGLVVLAALFVGAGAIVFARRRRAAPAVG